MSLIPSRQKADIVLIGESDRDFGDMIQQTVHQVLIGRSGTILRAESRFSALGMLDSRLRREKIFMLLTAGHLYDPEKKFGGLDFLLAAVKADRLEKGGTGSVTTPNGLLIENNPSPEVVDELQRWNLSHVPMSYEQIRSWICDRISA